MLYLKNKEEIELIRQSSLLVGKALAEVAKVIKPGITTLAMDKIADEFINDNKAKPAFKGYNGFPNALCISVNEHVVHGIPGKYELKDGDIVSVDCGVLMSGYYGDSAYTFAVGEINSTKHKLLKITYECLFKGIENAVVGKRVGDIGNAVQTHAEANGFTVVRELVGHGVGKELHESPEVPNYGKRGFGQKLQEGLVIAIEPMINAGKKSVKQESDGWTISTVDKMPSAHFEHTVAVANGKADILSSFKWIEEVLEIKKEKVVV